MSDAPTSRRFDMRPLQAAVEVPAGSGTFITDPRLVVGRVVLGSTGTISHADVEAWSGPIASQTLGQESSLDPASVLLGADRPGFGPFLRPEQKILIFRPRAGGSEADPESEQLGHPEREPILLGFVDHPRFEQHIGLSESGPQISTHYTLPVRGTLERVSTQVHAQILGRRMRNATAQDALDAALEDLDPGEEAGTFGATSDLVQVTALPCTFNQHGRPNCSAVPIRYELEDGTSGVIHVFADPDDPTAVNWTYARALRYLMFFHLFESQSGQAITEMPGLIKDGNVFAQTDDLAELTGEDQPEPPVEEEDAWAWAMLAEPRDLAVDAHNVVEALILLAEASGTRCAVKTRSRLETVQDEEGEDVEIDSGEPVDRLYWWARGTGPRKDLRMEGAEAGTDFDIVTEANNVGDLSLGVDHGDVVTDPIVVGDVRRYEITVSLVPGWEPDANVDDVADLDAARAYYEEHWDLQDDIEDLAADPWFQRYHPKGSEFPGHAHVMRRWILNENGRCAGADYGRTGGPFVAAAYTPWSPASCGINDTVYDFDAEEMTTQIVEAKHWTRRGRPLQPCFSADWQRRSLGIVLDVSFDAGATYYRAAGLTAHALRDEAGVYIESEDLTAIKLSAEADDEDNLWDAYLRGDLRVRVTAVIEGDERLQPQLGDPIVEPPIDYRTARIWDYGARGKSNRQEGGNSILKPGGSMEAPSTVPTEGDDLEDLLYRGWEIQDVTAGRRHAFAATVPWLTTDFEVGDSILEISGIAIKLLSYGGGQIDRRTDLVAIELLPGQTRLVYEEPAMLDKL